MLKRGDTAPSLIAVLKDVTGTAVDLTSSAVQFLMRLSTAASGTDPAVSGSMTLATDQVANRGQVTYNWLPGDTATPGTYFGEFVVTRPNGSEQTFPTTGFVTVVIGDDLESHLMSLRLAAPAAPRGVVLLDDDEAKASIARKTSATTAPLLDDDDLTALLKFAKRPTGGYNINRAAAEGWRWKAARAASGFTFTADGVQVDKSTIMAHCLDMVKEYSRGQVRTMRADTGLAVFESDYGYPA